MTNQKYVTGRRFKAKIQGVDYGELILKKCTAGCDWWDLFDMNGNCIICMREGDSLALSALGITDLILLPDTEPQKCDLVEVSNDGDYWFTYNEYTYTGGKKKDGKFIIEIPGGALVCYKHIRLAKPIPTERELAEKKAVEFLENSTSFSKYDVITKGTLTEYILKTQKS